MAWASTAPPVELHIPAPTLPGPGTAGEREMIVNDFVGVLLDDIRSSLVGAKLYRVSLHNR